MCGVLCDGQIERVAYPGLKSSRFHALAQRYLGGSGGGVLAFEVKGGKAAAHALLKVCLLEPLHRDLHACSAHLLLAKGHSARAGTRPFTGHAACRLIRSCRSLGCPAQQGSQPQSRPQARGLCCVCAVGKPLLAASCDVVDDSCVRRMHVQALTLPLVAPSLGGVESLITMPCMSTHAALGEAGRKVTTGGRVPSLDTKDHRACSLPCLHAGGFDVRRPRRACKLAPWSGQGMRMRHV